MDTRKIKTLEMLVRVASFLTTNIELFPKNTVAGDLLGKIQSWVDKLSGHEVQQLSGNRAVQSSVVSKDGARTDLRSQLELLNRTARAMNIDDKFWMPRNKSDRAYIAAGKTFAQDAEPLKAHFLTQGVAPDFIDNLKTAVRNLEQATQDEIDGKGVRSGSIAGFDDTLKQALGDLYRFDALVENTLGKNPELMAAWKIVRHVGKIPVRVKKAETPPQQQQQQPPPAA